MKIGTWVLTLVEPIIARILAALGFSVVTIVGFDAAVDGLRSQLVTSVNSLPADVLGVFLLAGGGYGLGMILGAVAVRVLMWQIQNATKILGVNPQ